MDPNNIWIIVVGVILLLVAAVLESYCEFGRQAARKYRPQIFETRTGILFWIGWIILFLGSCILLFFAYPIAAFVAVVVFWLLLPLWLFPAMRKRLLPPWEAVKEELESQGYTEKNYTSGDWWKKSKESEEEKRRGSRRRTRREVREETSKESSKESMIESTKEPDKEPNQEPEKKAEEK